LATVEPAALSFLQAFVHAGADGWRAAAVDTRPVEAFPRVIEHLEQYPETGPDSMLDAIEAAVQAAAEELPHPKREAAMEQLGFSTRALDLGKTAREVRAAGCFNRGGRWFRQPSRQYDNLPPGEWLLIQVAKRLARGYSATVPGSDGFVPRAATDPGSDEHQYEDHPSLSLAALRHASDHIESLFLETCLNGAQSADLPSGVFACGHYLDTPGRNQRGLHGMAAAVRVLAQSSVPRAPEAVRGLVAYLEDRETLERNRPVSPVEDTSTEAWLARDNLKTIKNAEILYALSFVRRGVANVDRLVSTYVDRLATDNPHGWPVFLDEPPGSADLLPTAYAIRALASHGYSTARQQDYLRNAVVQDDSHTAPPYVRVLTTLAVAELGLLPAPDIADILADLWTQLEPELALDVEAKIDFLRDRRHEYVYVPWQLYLLAAHASVNAWTSDSVARARTKLARVVSEVSRGGYVYPASGGRLSTRTHGILYDVIQTVAHSSLVGVTQVPTH
jgi:hypothetical protein